jgi:hypothetical protein
MAPDLWQRSEKLLEQSKGMTVQARGRIKTTTNLRVEPGRTEPRLYQFARGAEVEILGRAVADWVQVTDEKGSRGGREQEGRLVSGTRHRYETSRRRHDSKFCCDEHDAAGDQTIPIAGWVVARFISLDLPDPVSEAPGPPTCAPLPGSSSIA